MRLSEQKVLMQIRKENEILDVSELVFDTTAMDHVTGSQEAFSTFDSAICGSVKFGNGSIMLIEWHGMVLFSCKNGDHYTFADV